MSLLNLGFRPFFLGAGLFGVFTLVTWLYSYSTGAYLLPANLTPTLWHAHEMLFGYTTAVIAGFLLTATKNWTGRQTPHQSRLAFLFLVWASPRLLLVMQAPLWLAALLDILFNAWLFFAIALPIVATASKRQYPILGKLLFLGFCNAFFYSEALGLTEHTASFSLYLTLYVVIGLILMMCRRLIPFFIERGVGTPISLKNSKVLDTSCLVLFVAFLVADLFTSSTHATAFAAGCLAAALAVRGIWWHHPGIWRRPLLWSLYLGYWSLVLGFTAFALVPFGIITALMALHILTIGGIGLITVAMMARVALGHTGHNVQSPPKVVIAIFSAMLLSLIARVAGGVLFPHHYLLSVQLAGGLWILSFIIFVISYLPILTGKRIDNQYG